MLGERVEEKVVHFVLDKKQRKRGRGDTYRQKETVTETEEARADSKLFQ